MSNGDWEPALTGPSAPSYDFDGGETSSTAPTSDVIDSSQREILACRAKRGLLNRARTYQSAGNVGRKSKEGDDISNQSHHRHQHY